MQHGTCPITGDGATIENSGDSLIVSSWATGGRYRITGSAAAELPATLTRPVDRAKLVTWIVDQRRLGNDEPLVTTAELLSAQSKRPLGVKDRVDRIYLFLESVLVSIGDSLPRSNAEKGENWSTKRAMGALRAWTESSSDTDVSVLLDYARSSGFINSGLALGLTAEGWQHLEDMRRSGIASDQAFVAMWFNAEMDDAYVLGIAPAIEKAGYRPLVINRKEHNNKIDDEIIAEIRRSRFVVADFTCGRVTSTTGKVSSVPRGGVYYEAGFAKGLGLEVIWTVRSDCIDDVHFDTRQYNHIVWTTPAELQDRLVSRIGAVIGDGPLIGAGH